MTDWSQFYDDTRSDWNARPPLSARTVVDISRRTEFFNHYIGDGSPNFMGRPHSACLEKVLDWQWQHQHRPNDPWKDIGYNALVCGHARVIEERGLGYAGSHCPNHNTTGFGVQFMVAGSERPTDAMYARMRRLYDELVRAKGGALAKKGHRDGVSTTCPGTIVYAWVRAGMPAPTTITPPPEEDDMPTLDELAPMVRLQVLGALADTAAADTAAERQARDAIRTLVRGELTVALAGLATPEAVAAALAPLLAEQLPDAPLLTQEQIEAAFRAVLGSVDNTTTQEA